MGRTNSNGCGGCGALFLFLLVASFIFTYWPFFLFLLIIVGVIFYFTAYPKYKQ